MKKYSLISNIKYVYKESCRVNKPMKLWLFINLVASLLIPLLSTLLASIVVYILTNQYSFTSYILILIGIILLIIILEAVKTYTFERYTWENTFVRCNQFWRYLCKKAISCDYEIIEPKSGQKEVSKAFEALDSNWIGIEGTLKKTPIVVINFIGMVVYLILVAIYCPYVLIPMIFMVLIDFFLTRRGNKIIEKNREVTNASYYESYYLSKDVANPINGKDIRIYHLQDWFDRLFVSLTKKRLKYDKSYCLNTLYVSTSHSIFDFIRDGIAYIVLITMVINKEIDVSMFTFLIGIVAGFSLWTNQTSETFYKLKGDSTQVGYYRAFLDKEEKDDNLKKIDDLTSPYDIEFRNVCFTYPETDVEIIHDLSFKINGGEKIALVGNNGAGKTTIIKLLCGLYHPTSGEILINGNNIANYQKEEYIRLFSVVFQDTNPLSFTIIENVCCCPVAEADMNKFNEAINKAGLAEKINKLENKGLTYITQTFEEHGIKLSGGEEQKMMLARALYKDGKILVLDEPTSALDPLNEEKMYLTYEEYTKEKTSLFISHRLASTRFCNRIFYLENGRIVEVGTHEELLAKNGKYSEIFAIQAKNYKDSEAQGDIDEE